MARPRIGHDVFLRGAPEGLAVVAVPVYELGLYELLARLWRGPPPQRSDGADDRAGRLSFDGRGVAASAAVSRPRAGLARADGVSARGSCAARCFAARRSPRPSPRRSNWRAVGRIELRQDRAFGPIYLRSAAPGASATQPRMSERPQQLRLIEALLFAARRAARRRGLGAASRRDGRCSPRCCASWPRSMARRGVNLVRLAGGWAFRTAPDLAPAAAHRAAGRPQAVARRGRDPGGDRLSPAGHPRRNRGDPRRRSGKGTLDRLMEAGWVRPKGRRASPGRPLTLGDDAGLSRAFRSRQPQRAARPRRAARRRSSRPSSDRLAKPRPSEQESAADDCGGGPRGRSRRC